METMILGEKMPSWVWYKGCTPYNADFDGDEIINVSVFLIFKNASHQYW